MVLTGLRLGELASITVGRLHLDGRQPHAELLAKNAKAGQRALIPLRVDLVEDLRDWLDGKLDALREQAEEGGAPLPLKLPAGEPLFSVPRNLTKSFNRDSPYGGHPEGGRARPHR
jgi:integrase